MAATSRNLPASLTRKPASQATPAKPAPPADERIVLYLAVPDRRLITPLTKACRLFASRRSTVPLELRIFHEPNLPNTPFDDLALLGTLTEFGDVEGIDYVSVKPEDLHRR